MSFRLDENFTKVVDQIFKDKRQIIHEAASTCMAVCLNVQRGGKHVENKELILRATKEMETIMTKVTKARKRNANLKGVVLIRVIVYLYV